jgi:uncharacterized protein
LEETVRVSDHRITSEAQLRELIGRPADLVVAKITDRILPIVRVFIERSPFLCLATADADGNCDVSPRGDPAGFVRILDERTLLLPDRPGNKLADALRNILVNPHVALLFLLPGQGVTFRVNGTAELTTDPALLADSAIEGKPPKLGIVITVDEAYTQCAKAFLRSDVWNPEHYVEQADLPTGGEIMEQLAGIDADEYNTERAKRYERREGFY